MPKLVLVGLVVLLAILQVAVSTSLDGLLLQDLMAQVLDVRELLVDDGVEVLLVVVHHLRVGHRARRRQHLLARG